MRVEAPQGMLSAHIQFREDNDEVFKVQCFFGNSRLDFGKL